MSIIWESRNREKSEFPVIRRSSEIGKNGSPGFGKNGAKGGNHDHSPLVTFAISPTSQRMESYFAGSVISIGDAGTERSRGYPRRELFKPRKFIVTVQQPRRGRTLQHHEESMQPLWATLSEPGIYLSEYYG